MTEYQSLVEVKKAYGDYYHQFLQRGIVLIDDDGVVVIVPRFNVGEIPTVGEVLIDVTPTRIIVGYPTNVMISKSTENGTLITKRTITGVKEVTPLHFDKPITDVAYYRTRMFNMHFESYPFVYLKLANFNTKHSINCILALTTEHQVATF